MRIAALADIHAPRRLAELAKRLGGLEAHADVLLLCGDLTDSGDPHEARALANELRSVPIPIVAVLGNHDHEREQVAALCEILGEAGVRILDGDACVVGSLGIAGTKGFGGGFGKRRVAAFGEEATKLFAREGEREAQKLAEALRTLETPHRVAITHYAPILPTVAGEVPEIMPFLGDSQLAQVGEHAGVDAMFHGHSHFGRHEGRTERGVRVYNCAIPVLDALRPPRRFAVLELEVASAAAAVSTAPAH
jgi:Icc-related predicted phosphoesterase